jgi:hypothetical protein
MPDGRKYEFVGVTYGTNHVMGSLAARLASHLPGGMTNWVQKHFGKWMGPLRVYPNVNAPSLCVWFKRADTNHVPSSAREAVIIDDGVPQVDGPQVFCKLADENGLEGGTRQDVHSGNTLYPLGAFQVVPKRSKVLQLCFYQTATPVRMDEHTYYTPPGLREFGRVRFLNPLYGNFPKWQPEPIPAVKKAGDLEVHLEHFMTGGRGGSSVFLPGGQPVEEVHPGPTGETFFDVFLNSPSGSNGYWVIQNANVSDPGGNVIYPRTASSSPYASPMYGVGNVRRSVIGTLWPDEPAWRLKLEIKHTLPYAADELVTFKNVAVPPPGATNKVGVTNHFAGVQIVLAFLAHEQRRGKPYIHIRIEFPEKSRVAVDLAKVITDTGEVVTTNKYASFGVMLGENYWGPSHRGIDLSGIPTNTKAVDITLAVQKMRSVEFFVKPPN